MPTYINENTTDQAVAHDPVVGTGANAFRASQLGSKELNVKYLFGTALTPLKGDGSDETSALKAIIQYASQNLPMKIVFPNGTYGFTDLGSIAFNGLTLEGASNRGVVLKCLNTAVSHTALNCDAFWSGQVVGYVRQFTLRNLIIEGNSESEVLLFAQGLAECHWENVYLRGGKQDTTSIGFQFDDVELSVFTNLFVSNQIESSGTVFPYLGIRFNSGMRAGSATGACSNNQFNSCYFEGLGIGIRFLKGDQNIFVGGASEGHSVKGLEIVAGTNINRYNTFISTGFESDNGTYDIDDSGMSTQYINCYSSKYMILKGQSQKVSGGMYNTIEVTSSAVDCDVEHTKVNYFGGTGAGLIDSGKATRWRGIYNNNASAFMYPTKPRVGITVGASPYTWVNTTGNACQLFIAGGTVSGIQINRGSNGTGDPYSLVWNANVQPMMLTIPPNDGLTVTYTGAPAMSYREMNGY